MKIKNPITKKERKKRKDVYVTLEILIEKGIVTQKEIEDKEKNNNGN